VLIAIIIPVYCFFYLRKFNILILDNSSGIWIRKCRNFCDGSVFRNSTKFSGHMVAVMALMEAPAIIVGVILMFDKKQESKRLWDL
jgi:hypothetical protein